MTKLINQPSWRPTASERYSPAWQQLQAHLTARLADLRKDNDKEQTEAETAKLRGQISEIKRLIALNEDLPVPGSPDK